MLRSAAHHAWPTRSNRSPAPPEDSRNEVTREQSGIYAANADLVKVQLLESTSATGFGHQIKDARMLPGKIAHMTFAARETQCGGGTGSLRRLIQFTILLSC